ncbi:MAG: DUF4465 domain-containing protein [Bacteroidota bacterium]|nr:DUF4465 domain-containing protein [Bacteroidota bacterium]MDP3146214.1 DUF4465 domain-containing protein [Bacteroidota bacterium]MDP3556633.1 DUF4465 domain-containing protein [Bacteroidota bacterium]
MKKTITILTLALGIFSLKAQTAIADFETFTLSPNSAYTSTTSTPFTTSNASFQYKWDTGFNYWSGGFAYTNKYDSATAGFGNLYGVKPKFGYNNSNTYAIAQANGVINLSSPSNTVNGFYITNTTYAYKSMKLGDSFAKKFGGVSGNDPDFFKVTVRGYKGGVLLQDSVPFYLADFRFANNTLDYIVDTWQWVNTSSLGNVDSVKFFMYTSDNGNFGPNTPLFFGIDNFTTTYSTVGIVKNTANLKSNIYPNPFISSLTIDVASNHSTLLSIIDMNGKLVYEQTLLEMHHTIELNSLQQGIYMLELISGDNKTVKKLIKN